MVKLIIFDFDGTLVDSKEVSIRIYNQLAEKYNTRKIESIENIRSLPLVERFKTLDIPIYKLPFFAVDFSDKYKQILKEISMVPGMKELLIGLSKQGYQLAIVSANSENNIRDFFRENRLDVIGTIVNSTSIRGKDKAIKKLLTAQKLSPTEVIYVGDEIRDILACKKLGIRMIWVDWGYDKMEVTTVERPDYIVSSPQQILAIIN